MKKNKFTNGIFVVFLFLIFLSFKSRAQISCSVGLSAAYYPKMDQYYGLHINVNWENWGWDQFDRSQCFFSWNRYFGRVLPIHDSMFLDPIDLSNDGAFVGYKEKISFNDFQIGMRQYLWSDPDSDFGFYLHGSIGLSIMKDVLEFDDFDHTKYDANSGDLKPGTAHLGGVPIEFGFGVHFKAGNGFVYGEPRLAWPLSGGEYSTFLGSQSTYLPPHLSLMIGYRIYVSE